MNTTWTIEGISDDRDTCDCCGRQNLKRTVALRHVDSGAVEFLGTSCATQRMRFASMAEIRRQSQAAQNRKDDAVCAEQRRKAEAEASVWFAFLREQTGKSEVAQAIAAMGGFAAARAAFAKKSGA